MTVTSVSRFDQPLRPKNKTAGVFGDEMQDAILEKQAVSAERVRAAVNFIDWALRLPTAKGRMLDFERFPYQPEIYEVFGDDGIKDADAMKSVQVGMSELLTRLSLYFPDTRRFTSLYVFPALKQMYEFSDTRVNPLRENSEYLQSRTKLGPNWTWNKGLKRVGLGFVNYRGSESKNDLIAVDADLVALDEYDSLHMPNIPEAERRVSGSDYGLIRRVGVPSDPEYGISKRYDQSDKRVWMVKCSCKEGWQPITFWDNVVWDEDEYEVASNPEIVCRRCEKALDVLKGQWVAEHPERSRPGFHVHRLMVPGERNLLAVIESSKQREPLLVKSFWNNDLGLPFADATGGLNRPDIAAALSVGERYAREALSLGALEQVGAYTGGRIVTMGVDVASVRALNVRVSEHIDPLDQRGHRKRALFIGTVDSFNELPALMDRYNVHYACIDHLPEGRLAMGFATMFPGRVYVVNYSSQQIDVMRLDTEASRVSVQRVPAMDATAEIMRAQRNLLPADLPQDYVTHMVTPRRVVEKDEMGRMTVRWEERGPTDYFHSETYDVIATEVAKVRMEYEYLTREEVWQLDERLEFERSHVNDPFDQTYRPGPGSDPMDYHAGPGDDE